MPQSWLAEAGATAGISKLAVEAGATAGISKLALEVGADVFLKVQSQDHRGLRSSRLGVQGRTALHSPVHLLPNVTIDKSYKTWPSRT